MPVLADMSPYASAFAPDRTAVVFRLIKDNPTALPTFPPA